MTWTIALGFGMWAAAVFQDSTVPPPFLTWAVFGLLHVLLPLAEWQRVALFVLLRWGLGSWNLSSTQSDMALSDTTSPILVQLSCRPDFTASLGRTRQHGVFLCRNELGYKARLWLSVPEHRISRVRAKVDSVDIVPEVRSV